LTRSFKSFKELKIFIPLIIFLDQTMSILYTCYRGVMKKITSIITIILLMLFFTSCTKNKSISIESAWIRPGIKGNTTAGYFVIVNPTDQSDKLVSVSGNSAEQIEIHMTKMENDVMSMHEQEHIVIPANSKVEFKPQGLHIMLINLVKDFNQGNQIDLVFHFEKAGVITHTFDTKISED